MTHRNDGAYTQFCDWTTNPTYTTNCVMDAFNCRNLEQMSGMACSVYFSQYLLEAYCRAGHVEQAVKLMSSDGPCSWKAMIDFGSTITMEAWSIAAKDNLDMNHAWGAVPANIIARYVCGVTPLTPGFGTISIRPNLGGLMRFRARVPTAKGPVVLNVVNERIEVEVPSRSRIEWRENVYEVGAGYHVFGDERVDAVAFERDGG